MCVGVTQLFSNMFLNLNMHHNEYFEKLFIIFVA